MHPLLQKLTGGDRRSIGRSEEVAVDVLADPGLFPVLFEGMLAEDELVRMRAADALEKVSQQHPAWLKPFKSRILKEVASSSQQEVRWHVCQLFSRLELDAQEHGEVYAILQGYLEDESRIVRVFAMQALADLARQDQERRPQIIAQLQELTCSGSPSMRARGKKLLAKL
jgi:HEAT repeat protein